MLGNKLRELRARRAAGETGFTLVELLVVVVIIVALAAIAVPIFLNQQSKADDAAVRADLAAAGKFISAGIADGSLGTTAYNPATPRTVESGTVAGTLYTSSGTFTVPAGMTGNWDMGAGTFCATSPVGEADLEISNASGGVQSGDCA